MFSKRVSLSLDSIGLASLVYENYKVVKVTYEFGSLLESQEQEFRIVNNSVGVDALYLCFLLTV